MPKETVTTTPIEAVFNFLRVMEERENEYERVNAEVRKLQPHFPTTVNFIDHELFAPIRVLVNSILGCDVAEYYMCECRHMKNGGKIVEADGKEWPIRNLDDVRAYVKREIK